MIEACAQVNRRRNADFIEKAGKPCKSQEMLVLAVHGTGRMFAQAVALAPAMFALPGAIL
jgi:hypothetical protein